MDEKNSKVQDAQSDEEDKRGKLSVVVCVCVS